MKALYFTATLFFASHASAFWETTAERQNAQHRYEQAVANAIKSVNKQSTGNVGTAVKPCRDGQPLRNALGTACYPSNGKYTQAQKRRLDGGSYE